MTEGWISFLLRRLAASGVSPRRDQEQHDSYDYEKCAQTRAAKRSASNRYYGGSDDEDDDSYHRHGGHAHTSALSCSYYTHHETRSLCAPPPYIAEFPKTDERFALRRHRATFLLTTSTKWLQSFPSASLVIPVRMAGLPRPSFSSFQAPVPHIYEGRYSILRCEVITYHLNGI